MMQREEALGVVPPEIILEEQGCLQDRIASIVNKIHAARSTDELFLDLGEDLRNLFDVEQITLYAVDREKRELYSRFLLDPIEGIQEIRVPIDDRSISGFCARFGKILNIADAYDKGELTTINANLSFDRSWDERSGFRTRQVLAVPALIERRFLMGVLLLLSIC